ATDVNFFSTEVLAKRMQLLRELVPAAKSIALLVNPTEKATTESTRHEVDAVAGGLRSAAEQRDELAALHSIPWSARAQQTTTPVIGFLSAVSPSNGRSWVDGFREGLAEAGYEEGRNVAVEYRWSESQRDRLPALAADLIRHG